MSVDFLLWLKKPHTSLYEKAVKSTEKHIFESEKIVWKDWCILYCTDFFLLKLCLNKKLRKKINNMIAKWWDEF